jgi:hypothetical protein
MALSREQFKDLDYLIGANLGEDWHYEFDGVYEAAEAWVMASNEARLGQLVGEIDALFAQTSTTSERRDLFSTQYSFSTDTPTFDIWLHALRDRAAAAVAGGTEPMKDPDSAS